MITHNAKCDEDVFPFCAKPNAVTDEDSLLRASPEGVAYKFFDDESDEEHEAIEKSVENKLNVPTDSTKTDDSLKTVTEQPLMSQPNEGTNSLPIKRTSSRLAGHIPNYRGMTAALEPETHSAFYDSSVVELSALASQFDCLPECLNTTAIDLTSPKSFSKATQGPEGEKWLQA